MDTFPAVMIGGAPHTGKSTLAHHLSMRLRSDAEHYLLRATPDGEGDWSYQASPHLARALRIKGTFTPAWIEGICQDISARHLPFLVDVGGLPQPDQEVIFDRCTHAIVLSRTPEEHDLWVELARRHSLIILADLHSDLHGQDAITSILPALQGTIAGLDRVAPRLGVTFDALVERLRQLFDYDAQELRGLHLAEAPAEIELLVDLDRLADSLGADHLQWEPRSLPQVLDYLPAATPLALYGRAPAWLYAAIARHVWPADLWQFDARLGWVRTPALRVLAAPSQAIWETSLRSADGHLRLEFTSHDRHLDLNLVAHLPVPPIPSDQGLILSGKLPQWVWTALVRTYHEQPWLAVFAPREQRAVVVWSRVAELPPGSMLP
jgi:CRISPR-associated protein Csx3